VLIRENSWIEIVLEVPLDKTMYKTLTRNKKLPTFFGKVQSKGKL
jgi:hypothetical protein